MVFNQPDVTPFREKLRKAGFYAEWKGKYGDEAWATPRKVRRQACLMRMWQEAGVAHAGIERT